MNEYDAERNGYHYCGPTLSSYARQKDLDNWELDKKVAKDIKKNYTGADYVIVTGTKYGWLSQGTKAIYGNATFDRIYHLVRYEHDQISKEKLAQIMQDKKAKAEADYQKALEEIKHYQESYEADLQFLETHKK